MVPIPDIRLKPPCSRDDALAVLQRLRDAGHVAYFAGGCVRDTLLGLAAKDWDVATDAPPKRVRELFSNTQAVGQAFGVILVRINASVVEVATFRSDDRYVDGRRPSQVHFTTPQEDAQRRDFTINGLFFDPVADRVIDFVGGCEDLKSRVIRAIGEPAARFAEDHLRLLRAVRFAARFDFAIEPATRAAIVEHAPMLKRISPERIADELRLMLTAPTRERAWRLLWELRLVQVVWRFSDLGLPAALDERRCPFVAASSAKPISFGLALAAANLSCAMQSRPADADVREFLRMPALRALVRAMRQALKISNDEAGEMGGAMASLAVLLGDELPSVAKLKRFLALPTAASSRALLHALARAGVQTHRAAQLRPVLDELARHEVAPAPLVTGDDLVAAGLSPGPAFKRILDQVYDEQLEGRLRTKPSAMETALRLAARR
jgi:tRNA nucleotidyltransferase/poly(A) polymerase